MAVQAVPSRMDGLRALLPAPAAEQPIRRLRALLERFLMDEGGFGTLPDKRTGASLGAHLLGTFDLLAERRCAGSVCAAGALHSIYGTAIYRHALVEPTPERRAAVARAFGPRGEHLAYAFHGCKRPGDLERGSLSDRTGIVAWSQRDLDELRLVEAANIVEQGGSLAAFPAIAAAWQRAAADANALAACEFRTAPHAARTRAFARGLELLGCAPRYFLWIAYAGHFLDVPLPVAVNDRRVSEWLLDLAGKPAGVRVGGFVLAGEGSYGMPACGLELLNLLGRFACCRFRFERCARCAIAIEPVLISSGAAEARTGWAAAEASCAAVELPPLLPPFGASLLGAVPLGALLLGSGARHAAGRALVSQLRARGWAKVAVDCAARESVTAAYAALRELSAADVSVGAAFDGGRFVGSGGDGGRYFVNWRAGLEDEARAPWPPHLRSQRDALARAHGECEGLARAALCAVLAAMAVGGLAAGLSAEQLLLAPAAGDSGAAAVLAEVSERQFGPSVQRFLLYRDRPRTRGVGPSASSPHADLGLLTLAPAATIPALELVEPSGRLSRPEDELADGEWLLFAGETLAFLTAGALQAPVHRVPWVERGARPPRCAAPFFLRAAPWALLRNPSGSVALSCRELMERHCATRRPWRGVRRGALSVGDW